jgi:predicted methyltransferase
MRNNMKLSNTVLIALASLMFSTTVWAEDISDALDKAIQGSQRDAANVARDVYRHPKETLTVFDLSPDMKALEILPGGGWYTEILAPLMKDSGELTVASFGENHPTKYLRDVHNKFMKKIGADAETYGKVKTVLFENNGYLTDIPDGSLDIVMTFRNSHNWIRYGGIEDIFAAFNRVLKPSGVLGVVQHRAADGSDPKVSAEKGYIPKTYLIELIEANGFELVKSSDINANPKDTKDYSEGVWTLPPSYRAKNKDKAKYAAIGESDRMTLKFIKQ